MQDQRTIRLGIANWKVERAYPPSDIIWNEIQNVAENESCFKSKLYLPIYYINSILVIALILFFDYWAFGRVLVAQFVFQYFSPLALGFYTLYAAPKLVFKINQWENHERKSIKENSFLKNLNLMFGFNMIIALFIIAVLLQSKMSFPNSSKHAKKSSSRPK